MKASQCLLLLYKYQFKSNHLILQFTIKLMKNTILMPFEKQYNLLQQGAL